MGKKSRRRNNGRTRFRTDSRSLAGDGEVLVHDHEEMLEDETYMMRTDENGINLLEKEFFMSIAAKEWKSLLHDKNPSGLTKEGFLEHMMNQGRVTKHFKKLELMIDGFWDHTRQEILVEFADTEPEAVAFFHHGELQSQQQLATTMEASSTTDEAVGMQLASTTQQQTTKVSAIDVAPSNAPESNIFDTGIYQKVGALVESQEKS